MSWTETDDSELQEGLDRLTVKQKELQDMITSLQVLINNTTKIKTREATSYTNKRERIITKILPKDKWGEEMTDEYRLKVKDECITKTNELLGKPDE